MNDNNIENVIQILSTCSTMKEASLALKKNERTLRKWFKKFGLPHPSTFLNTRINNLLNDLELSDTDQYIIRINYPDGIHKGLTVEELGEKINKPVSKIKDYIKEIKLTHNDVAVKPVDFNSKKLNEDIKQYLDSSLKKNTTERITDSLRNDAKKWRNWKETTQRELYDLISKKVPQYKVEKKDFPNTESKYAAILALQDYHYGRLSSILENFDGTTEKEKEELLFKALSEIFEKIRGFGIAEKLYITVGGDFLNSDNQQGTTTNGTPQDSFPSHTELMYGAGMLMVKITDFSLRYFKEIEFVVTLGNHDRSSSVSLYMFLCAWYKNSNDVITGFDNFNTQPRQYRQYENTLLAFHHGDGPKIKDWPILIANEASEIWGKTKHRVLIIGHRHSRINEDMMGIQKIQVPSFATEDKYSTLHGYQSKKGVSLILIDSKRGYFAEIFANCS